ncbi:TetR family transcriptional regulator [Cellvibrio polysaccharolyticus]|uniref:TetR family transcriptional regulator n=1 Tax=Cellvibrio polysaccharolyticus TaxID=2082724 RepID=A0A928UZV3_9GAMM|nr:TetR family transcriptional regulator [Cellvibrio polysaccharolyticus]MBE8715717.1 TetR family transcriptional regulator [Cellvibrio polysaccharolyticus]
MARKTREESEKTRQSILDAAESVFLARGLATATMADIADAAGMSRGAVYGHYKNKQEVAMAMCHRGFQEIIDTLPPFKAPWCEQIIELLQLFLRRSATCSSSERVLEILYIKMEEHEENCALFRLRDVFEKRWNHTSRKLLQQAVKNGELPAGLDLDMANASLLSLYHGISCTQIWRHPVDKIDWDMIDRQLRAWSNTLRHCPEFIRKA